MRILWPDAIGYDELLHVDVYEASIFEPPLQFDPWTCLIAGHFECAVNFLMVPLEASAVETPVLRAGVAVPVLELNPPAWPDWSDFH